MTNYPGAVIVKKFKLIYWLNKECSNIRHRLNFALSFQIHLSTGPSEASGAPVIIREEIERSEDRQQRAGNSNSEEEGVQQCGREIADICCSNRAEV